MDLEGFQRGLCPISSQTPFLKVYLDRSSFPSFVMEYGSKKQKTIRNHCPPKPNFFSELLILAPQLLKIAQKTIKITFVTFSPQISDPAPPPLTSYHPPTSNLSLSSDLAFLSPSPAFSHLRRPFSLLRRPFSHLRRPFSLLRRPSLTFDDLSFSFTAFLSPSRPFSHRRVTGQAVEKRCSKLLCNSSFVSWAV